MSRTGRAESLWVDDYFMAHKVFAFDLSASRRDRADRRLIDEIYSALDTPACLMGWRSARNVEHEMVAFAARRGLFVLCALHTLNLTVHTALPKPAKPFKQRHITADEVGPVEKKVYIALMNTDGDSFGSMLGLQSGRFREPEHGRLPYTWAYLPLAYDLLPGVARYNYELRKENDYFAASTCGAAYTYPHLLPDTRDYLRYSRYYMEKTDLRTAYMANWDDDFWWQEMETPGFLEAHARRAAWRVRFRARDGGVGVRAACSRWRGAVHLLRRGDSFRLRHLRDDHGVRRGQYDSSALHFPARQSWHDTQRDP